MAFFLSTWGFKSGSSLYTRLQTRMMLISLLSLMLRIVIKGLRNCELNLYKQPDFEEQFGCWWAMVLLLQFFGCTRKKMDMISCTLATTSLQNSTANIKIERNCSLKHHTIICTIVYFLFTNQALQCNFQAIYKECNYNWRKIAVICLGTLSLTQAVIS